MSEVKNNTQPIDAHDLYRREIYTDGKNGDITVLVPVTSDGGADVLRRWKFFSSVTVAFRGRPVPCNFEIPAETLPQALAAFSEAAQTAGEGLVKQHLESQSLKNSLIAPAPGHFGMRPN